MDSWVIILISLVSLFIMMIIVAHIRAERNDIDTVNPYIDSTFSSILPAEMQKFAETMPTKPVRRRGVYERVFKSLMDNILAFLGLVILSPLFFQDNNSSVETTKNRHQAPPFLCVKQPNIFTADSFRALQTGKSNHFALELNVQLA